MDIESTLGSLSFISDHLLFYELDPSLAHFLVKRICSQVGEQKLIVSLCWLFLNLKLFKTHEANYAENCFYLETWVTLNETAPNPGIRLLCLCRFYELSQQVTILWSFNPVLYHTKTRLPSQKVRDTGRGAPPAGRMVTDTFALGWIFQK